MECRYVTRLTKKFILKNFKMLSVNQVNAQVKLLEMWKANNVENYPLKVTLRVTNEDERTTRAVTSKCLIVEGKSNNAFETFKNDSSRA